MRKTKKRKKTKKDKQKVEFAFSSVRNLLIVKNLIRLSVQLHKLGLSLFFNQIMVIIDCMSLSCQVHVSE